MKGFLYGKTAYNIGENIVKINEYVRVAKENNYTYLSITDNNFYGYYKFYCECKKHNIKPLIGLELEINHNIIIMYAKNYKALKDLFRLDYLAKENKLTEVELKELTKDCLIILPLLKTKYYNDILNKEYRRNEKDILKLKESFNLIYIGIPLNNEDINITNLCIEFSNYFNLKAIYTHEIRYLNKEDYIPYATLLKMNSKKDDYVKEFKFYFPKEINPKSNEILASTNKFVNSINIEISEKIEKISYVENDDEYLKNLSLKGLYRRLNNNVNKNYLKRLNKELEVIKEMGYSGYFLVVYDFICFAKKNKVLVGPARGSAAGSLVAYTVGITEIDPIKHNLIFERFLNKARKTMPDIDTDFPDDKREYVLEYVKNKYGLEKVSLIQTFQSYTKKVILNEIKTFAKDKMDEVLYKDICKKIEEENFNYEVLKAKYQYNEDVYNIYHTMERLEGLPKNVSKHAAGVIISNTNLTHNIPTSIDKDFLIANIEDHDLENLGYLKIDFLGIRNLRIIQEILDLLNKDHTYLKQIPFNSEKVFNLLKLGDTLGIFQLESKGVREVLRKMRPNCFLDIAHTLALYRPGTIKNIDQFILNKQKGHYKDIDPLLHDILKETYGVILYQEQIIEISRVFAGYTLEEADILRRAISKKDKDIMLKEKENFIDHAKRLNRPIEKINEIYDLIAKFADYSFNKSHSIAYATISYQMAYLKCHHFKEFMTSILNNVIGDANKTKEYIDYSIERGLEFMGIDVNISEDKYIIKDNKIYIPFTIIKNLAGEQTKEILRARSEAEFKNFSDFKRRVKINEPILERIVYLEGFKHLNQNINEMINMSDLNMEIFKTLIGDMYQETKDTISKKELKEKELEYLGFNLTYDEFKNLKRLRYLNRCLTLNSKSYNTTAVVLVNNLVNKNKNYFTGVMYDETLSYEFKCYLNYKMQENNYYKVKYKIEKNEYIITYIEDLKIKHIILT